MTVEMTLDTALGELERPAVPGRSLEASSANARLAALVAEIDATILARELVVENEDGKLVSCDVSNRRLYRLSEVAFEYLDDPGMMNTNLSDGDDEAIDGLRQIFEKLVGVGTKLSVRSDVITNKPKAGEIGLSATALFQRWELDGLEEIADERSAETIACAFAKDLASSGAISLVWKNESAIAQYGDDAQISELSAYARDHLAQLWADLASAPSDGDITAIASDADEADSLIVAHYDGETVLVRIPSSATLVAFDSWRQLLKS